MTQTNLALLYIVFGCGLVLQSKTLEEKGEATIITMMSWLMASYMLECGKTGTISPIVGSIIVVAFTSMLFLLSYLLEKMTLKYSNVDE